MPLPRPTEKDNIYVFHDNDLDGYAAASCLHRKYGEDATYFPSSDRYEVPNAITYAGEDDLVFFLDTVPLSIERLLELDAGVVVIDHHKSYAEKYKQMVGMDESVHHFLRDHEGFSGSNGGFTYFYHEERSAAVLAWIYANGQASPRLLRHIQDFDLWQFEMDGTEEIVEALKAKGPEYRLIQDYLRDPSSLINYGEPIVAARDEKLMTLASSAEVKVCRFGDRVLKAAICNNPREMWRSFLGEQILERYPDADLAFLYRTQDLFGEEPRIRVSLRGREDGPDLGQIASQFGGGGHTNAAGFETNLDVSKIKQIANGS